MKGTEDNPLMRLTDAIVGDSPTKLNVNRKVVTPPVKSSSLTEPRSIKDIVKDEKRQQRVIDKDANDLMKWADIIMKK